MAEQTTTIHLPDFYYISQKNTYSGSFGRFRYKVFSLKKDDIETVIVAAYYFDNCFEAEDEAGRTTKQEFPYNPDGLKSATDWLVLAFEQNEQS